MLNKENIKKLKLIVFDLDGTLLDDEGQIGVETKTLIKQLKQRGVQFTFATQRVHSSILDYAAQLEINVPLISLDGALIQSYPNKVTIFESFVPEKYVRKAIYLADKFLLKIALCHAEAIFYTEYNSTIPFLLDKYGAAFKEVLSYDTFTRQTLEVIITGEQNDAVKYLSNQLSFPCSFGLDSSYFKSHSREGNYFLEVRKGGSSKAKGVKRLLRHLKLNIRQTAVVGDWYNDRSLFETNALKIAVANAVPEIKRLADYITKKTNDEDGVAEFLEMVLRSKKE
ncbi:MAG: Cof-type HAD-IIB family hydrolase [Ignavibacteriales bacterium]|nr:Cof-type HAD-IIB family hydrolase [Ignavibacteriales bacterium]